MDEGVKGRPFDALRFLRLVVDQGMRDIIPASRLRLYIPLINKPNSDYTTDK